MAKSTMKKVLKAVLYILIGLLEVFVIALLLSWMSNFLGRPLGFGYITFADPTNPNHNTLAKGLFENPFLPSLVFGAITYFVVKFVRKNKKI